MMRKLVWIFFFIPVALIMLVLAVSNRHDVTMILDPFSTQNPAITITLPLFFFLFAALFIGLLVGGFAAWIAQSKWRQQARNYAEESYQWRQKAGRLSHQLKATEQSLMQDLQEARAQNKTQNAPAGQSRLLRLGQ